MKTESLKRLAVLGLSSEQMSVVLDVLAVELAPMERTRELAAQRQQRYVERNYNVRLTSLAQRQANVTPDASRVENKPLPFLTTEKKEEKGNLSVSPKAPSSKPLWPDGFAEWFAIYPKREGDADRAAAAKAFGAALKRTTLQNLLDGAKRYAAFCDANGNTGTQFVLKARKWLNDHGWENSYETSQHRPKPGSIAGSAAIIDAALAAEETAIREEEEGQRFGETHVDELPRLRQVN